MAKLILSMDGLLLKEILLTKERTTIGRKPHNDIQIDNLAISGEHAVVITILNDSFLEDLGSTNGTFVNGQAIKKHFLQNSDTIELGKYRLKYVNDAPQQSGDTDFEKTMILRPGAAARPAESTPAPASAPAHAQPVPVKPVSTSTVVPEQSVPQSTAPAVAPSAAPTATPTPLGVIQVLTGNNVGKELELTKTLTTLGKPGVQVAVIARRPHGYFITHVEGAKFPVVNGKALGTQAHPLADHDIIELAGTKMEFFLKG
jgi:pSer/pThr/pTyr-binding forkhead associated (FHA) protein